MQSNSISQHLLDSIYIRACKKCENINGINVISHKKMRNVIGYSRDTKNGIWFLNNIEQKIVLKKMEEKKYILPATRRTIVLIK